MTLPRGRIKSCPEDFVVEEIPAYEPSGEGTHLFLKFEKKGLTTDAAVRSITKALGIEMRDVGIAGMKDKVALTTQWVSVPTPPKDPTLEERAKALVIDGIRVLDAKRHGNKLKTGHLRGNRFDIIVRDVPPEAVAGILAAMERFGTEGVPNAFGVQRFGKEGDNAQRARAWLTGKERAPNDPRLRRFHFSALQSAVFNALLEARVQDGTWRQPVLGDLLKKEDTGGIFVCTDVQADRERADRGELCPTGPIIGDKMRWPEGEVKALEERIAAPFMEGVDLKRARSLGEGTRRALRLRVTACSVAEVLNSKGVPGEDESDNREQGRALRVQFVLPKGAYATTVLANAFDVIDGSRDGQPNADTDAGIPSMDATGEDGPLTDAKTEEE
ncbi:MAG TPA: tRNA pseudouridine(13) synthase TruD [Labilithrix sp.]|nr:tRNA pseudouridine(13) synthase TruD [Labilithrix sp.]